jgi:PAS domain S-box-containing protein
MPQAEPGQRDPDPPKDFCLLCIGDDAEFRETLQAIASERKRFRLVLAGTIEEAADSDILPQCDMVVVDSRGAPDAAVRYIMGASAFRFIRPTIFITDIVVSELEMEFEVVPDLDKIDDAVERSVARAEMEHTLAESEKMYRDLFEKSGDAIFIHRPGGRFFAVNNEACVSLGYTKEELLRMGPEDINNPASSAMVNERISGLLKDGEMKFEVLHVRKDGSAFPVEVKLRMFDHGGGPAIISTVRDITERKSAEEAIVHANSKLGLLGAITRHDISNKLVAIYGYLEALKENGDTTLRKRYVQKALDAAAIIAEQVRFAGDYQKAGTSDPVWVDIAAVVENASAGFEALTIAISPELRGLQVNADPMLERVFWNLMDNAQRHGDGATKMTFAAERRGSYLIMVVEDDGVGILDEEKERIFEAGYGRHTGMGLFLIKEILGITGITILENGGPGQGARFEIAVPQGKYRNAG